MANKKNLFKELVRFVNSCNVGEDITRKEIIEALDKIMIFPRYSDGKLQVATVDVYRRYLSAADYLKDKTRGVYTFAKEIPRDLSLTQLIDQAYNKLDKETNDESR